MKARKPRKRPAKVRYYSRRMMLQLLSDLCDRIKKQRHELDAIAEANVPNDKHIVAEHRVRTVMGILLEKLQSRQCDIEGFARIIRTNAGPPGDHFTQSQPVEWVPRSARSAE
jgi:hypothetical protein